MPVRLSSFQNTIKTVAVDLGEGMTINVRYRLGEVTPGRIDYAQALVRGEVEGMDDATQGQAWTELVGMIEGWDLVDDEDNEMPVTVETVSAVPMPILNEILAAIMTDTRPNPTRSRRSGHGSFAAK